MLIMKTLGFMDRLLAFLKKAGRGGIFYLSAIVLLILMVVGVPFLVRRGVAMTSHVFIEQEVLQALLIAALLSAAFALSHRYKTTLNAHREEMRRLAMNNDTLLSRLTEAFKYIGKVNVQLQEIRSVFFHLNRLPENRNDFKNLLRVFARKVLAIVNTDWAVVRIIERQSLRTITEHLEFRRREVALYPHIGNKSVIDAEPVAGQTVIRCEKENLDITVVCIFPRGNLSREERILVEAIAGEIELLFITFTALQFDHNDALRLRHLRADPAGHPGLRGRQRRDCPGNICQDPECPHEQWEHGQGPQGSSSQELLAPSQSPERDAGREKD
jgi:hypothetical protein